MNASNLPKSTSSSTAGNSPAFLDGGAKQLLIDGKWVAAASGQIFPSYNPSTGRELDPLALGEEEDVNRAVAAARRALEGPWSKFKPRQRQAVLLKLAQLIESNYDELALLDTLDMGMPVSFAPYMKPVLLGTYEYCAARALALEGETLPNSVAGDIFSFTVREPVGVVGGIIPWNGPVFNATWKIAPVLATGCTLVLKAAEQASYSPLRLGELCLEAGIPPGVINVISGLR
jgi:aldehyde dehydrogenase (NAD+)